MTLTELAVSHHADLGVGVVEIRRPPNNFLDIFLLDEILDAFRQLDTDEEVGAIVLRSAGKHFCAGRDFSKPRRPGDESSALYARATGLFDTGTPWVAALQGGAIGAGAGLAAAADFRIATSRAYFWTNFVKFGLHPGFGLTATLPRIVGPQRTAWMLTTAERVDAKTALAWGLVDQMADEAEFEKATLQFAARIAACPPAAIRAVRETLRGPGLRDAFRAAIEHESAEQTRLIAERSEQA